ncbi:hypothetical protein BIV25_28385 [Streptomyces sp. MUSC 14]|uniref:SCO2400 family protein n=1 Tax=Streptomyces sp. MUSC 14 TaxID=1354889 RepID=UPI0008F595E2|nr:hypothetical protein [Streptomyces sp. MUSC 14]OIJ92219.1 hypothetical protein BIV25_28385 [Streptomyces sp. MUSC 14]
MDYCSSCRRHLNGALVCPGCGAYAPDIAPPGTDGHSGAYASGTASPHIPSTAPAPAPALDDTAWYDGVPAAGPAEYGAEATAGAADVTDAPRAPQGRAARRRQLARWKKSQRRAVVATAVALVGGGLAFSSMDRGSGDRAQAATAPDNRSMGLGEEQPASPTPPASSTPPPSAPRHAAPTTSGASTGSTAQAPAGYSYVPQQQSHTSAPHTARSATRPDSVPTTPRPTGTSAPNTGTSTNSSTRTGSSTSSTPTPPPTTSTAPSTPSNSSGSSGSSSSSSSSNQLCLVVICLGGS